MLKQVDLGVFDKDGVEIREGDILLCKNGLRFLIFYKECQFIAEVINNRDGVDHEFSIPFLLEYNEVKVIGNKYENEGLLEKGELF